MLHAPFSLAYGSGLYRPRVVDALDRRTSPELADVVSTMRAVALYLGLASDDLETAVPAPGLDTLTEVARDLDRVVSVVGQMVTFGATQPVLTLIARTT